MHYSELFLRDLYNHGEHANIVVFIFIIDQAGEDNGEVFVKFILQCIEQSPQSFISASEMLQHDYSKFLFIMVNPMYK